MTPLDYYEELWNRGAEIAVVHAYLSKQTTPAMPLDELLRSEWVSRVSALDLYVHEIVAQNMMRAFDGVRTHSRAFARFMVTTETMMRIQSANSQVDASAAFDLAVRGQLERITYQFPDDVADGIRLVSDVELWNEVAMRLGACSKTKQARAQSLKQDLTLIVRRRNKIAHEGDLQPGSPRTPWAISRGDLEHVTKVIDSVVRAIDDIV